MNWIRKIMVGRYGVDQLSNAMVILSIVLVVTSMFTKISAINSIGMVILAFSYFRIFSKNTNKRYQENLKFLKWWNPIKSKWLGIVNRAKHLKTHRYFKCPQCNKELRVPRGKGKITITCPKCHTKFEQRT